MKKSRIIVAGIAAVATLGAFFLSSAPPPEPPKPEAAIPAPAMPTVEVMVASADVLMGQVVSAPDVKWVPFPKDSANPAFILKEGSGDEALKKVVGAIARHPFIANEPMRLEKLIQSNGSGFLSAILPPGKRAVAVTTEPSGATSAGGFILPNDHVDVIRVLRDEEAARTRGANAADALKSELVVTNVRVLAIGQNVQERGGEKFITSQTATLELDPRQTEQVVLAQRQGSLSLALRSIQDINKVDAAAPVEEGRRPLTLVRFGLSSDLVTK